MEGGSGRWVEVEHKDLTEPNVGSGWNMGEEGELYKRRHTPTPENSQTSQLLPLGEEMGVSIVGGG